MEGFARNRFLTYDLVILTKQLGRVSLIPAGFRLGVQLNVGGDAGLLESGIRVRQDDFDSEL